MSIYSWFWVCRFMGNARITNLSHSAFMGIGAYAAAICVTPQNIKALSLPNAPWGLNAFSFDPISSALISIAVTAAVAFLVGYSLCAFLLSEQQSYRLRF